MPGQEGGVHLTPVDRQTTVKIYNLSTTTIADGKDLGSSDKILDPVLQVIQFSFR